jgi:DNA-binding SARP family transcriptional activator
VARGLLEVRLFGRFSIRYGGEPVLGRAPRKVQELVAYLCLHQERASRRDDLVRLLWGEGDLERGRKYLRQSLWLLQRELNGETQKPIDQDRSWVKIRPAPGGLWVDALTLESVFRASQGVDGSSLDAPAAESLSAACDLYRGDLLEGWYGAWCLADRDRYREIYLAARAKLAAYHESKSHFEIAMAHAKAALQLDRANESIHRMLMRLLYRSGDRTGALRQFERCRTALREELGVDPSQETNALLDAIRLDRIPR